MSTFHTKNADYIILGTGCAGLSLVMRMIRSGRFSDKKVLLIDKGPKTDNDRTWCYWEKQNGFFEEIVYKKWSSLNFFGPGFSTKLNISPYQYKMIRGIDFYRYCFGEITKQDNIEIVYGTVKDIGFQNNEVVVSINDEIIRIAGSIVFNSIYRPADADSDKAIRLLQHFKGWIIETDKPVFNPSGATLMDFRVRQDNGTTFGYILPISETKALVEYTLFSARLLSREQYDKWLKDYIENILKIDNYKVVYEEFGVIPMTNKRFRFYENGIYHIGTAGGQTKASSGYTFGFIQKQAQQIIDHLTAGKSLQSMAATPGRFRFYDTVLLRVLAEGKLGGDKIFTRLFQRNKTQAVFKFLDNETSIGEELKLISTLPTYPFLKAALHFG
ncbi:MAG: lycopene cyclase [Bacteroidetes bacterium]|nr:lycopene cyclase [Bacteroidota bacterium]